jgi:hypothetical protein
VAPPMARAWAVLSGAPMPEGSEKRAKTGKSGKSAKLDKAVRPGVAPVPEPPAGPTSRINIALPFSQLRMQEPSQELADVVALIGELVAALEGTLTPTQYEEFEAQVDSLRARLR